MLELTIFSLLNGVVYGLLLFMITSGMTLIFGMMGVLNLAHASFYMLGAYIAYQISLWFNFWVALVVAPLIVGAFGCLVERYGLSITHKYGNIAELLLTVGIMYIMVELVQIIWGRLPVRYTMPKSLDFTFFTLWGINYSAYRIFMMIISIGMLFSLYLILTKTRIGLIIQASLTHPDMVKMLGHNVPRIFMITFGVGCALAGLAGVIGGNLLCTEPAMVATISPLLFSIVVIGGLGSIKGAFVASILIGLIQTFAISVDYSLADLGIIFGLKFTGRIASTNVAQMAPTFPFLLLVLILIFRPKGLMGVRET